MERLIPQRGERRSLPAEQTQSDVARVSQDTVAVRCLKEEHHPGLVSQKTRQPRTLELV